MFLLRRFPSSVESGSVALVAVAFDTLAYARRLRQAGFSEQQAEVQAEALAAVVTETLATKDDLRELASKHDLAAVREDLRELASKHDLAAVKEDLRAVKEDLGGVKHDSLLLKQELRELEYRLTVRLGAMMAVGLGAVAALVKLA